MTQQMPQNETRPVANNMSVANNGRGTGNRRSTANPEAPATEDADPRGTEFPSDKSVRKVAIPVTHGEAAVLEATLRTAVSRLIGW